MPGQLIDSGAIFAPLSGFKRLGLAVSGGPDSLALMLLAAEYAETTGSHERFVVYSVDHGLRAEAADEVAFVVDTATRLGLPAHGLRWEGPRPASGIQQAARSARYRLMAAAMAGDGAEVLVTAHHLGDQAETVLMRLAHGSGIEGLRGMDYSADVAGLMIVRPLLDIDPADLLAVVKASGLRAVADPSNADTDYERVRWRQLLPRLAELGLDARRLARFARRMRDADEALDAMADDFAGVHNSVSSAQLDQVGLFRLPRAVAIRVLQRVLRQMGGGRKANDLAPVEALADRIRANPALKRTSLHGCLISSDGTSITIERETGRRALVDPAPSVTRN